MIIVRNAKNKDGQRSSDFIQLAIGELDNYGNPFEIVTLVWNKSHVSAKATYEKTRGFEDTEIIPKPGGIEVRHIRKGTGSIQWMPSAGRFGAYQGQLGKTPYNMRKLATHYRDDKWRIKEPHIDAEVRAMSDKIWAEMDEETQKFNLERIRRLKMLRTELNDDNAYERNMVTAKAREVEEEKKLIAIQKRDLAEREARIKALEENLTKKKVEAIEAGAAITGYSKVALEQMPMHEVRRAAREIGVKAAIADTKPVLIRKILTIQEPALQEAVETVAE